MRYLLDTNVISDYVRGNPQIDARIQQNHLADLAISSITCMEIEQGFLLSNRSRERYELITSTFLKDIHILNFDQEVAIVAAQLRIYLKKNHPQTGSATPAGNEDLYIAATALTHNLILVTHNTSDFLYFPNLRLEDWKI
jgi:tRNA(fMet)-specific endonuclease VapC